MPRKILILVLSIELRVLSMLRMYLSTECISLAHVIFKSVKDVELREGVIHVFSVPSSVEIRHSSVT